MLPEFLKRSTGFGVVSVVGSYWVVIGLSYWVVCQNGLIGLSAKQFNTHTSSQGHDILK